MTDRLISLNISKISRDHVLFFMSPYPTYKVKYERAQKK